MAEWFNCGNGNPESYKTATQLFAEQQQHELELEEGRRRYKSLMGTLADIRDLLVVNSMQNVMLLRGMEMLVVQRLGVPFLNDKDNTETMKQIAKIYELMDERNGLKQIKQEELMKRWREIVREINDEK